MRDWRCRPSDLGTVSFVMHWGGIRARLHVRDLVEHFDSERIEASNQRESRVEMVDGSVLTVFSIARGHDMGDAFAHVTTNINPRTDSASARRF